MGHDFLGRSSGKFPGRSNETFEKVVLERPKKLSQTCSISSKPSLIIFEISYKPSRPFFGKLNWFVQKVNAIPEGNLPVPNFAYHLPKSWTDRFALESAKQPLS